MRGSYHYNASTRFFCGYWPFLAHFRAGVRVTPDPFDPTAAAMPVNDGPRVSVDAVQAELFRGLADGSPSPLWLQTPAMTLHVNEAFFRYFGRDGEDVQRAGWHVLLHPEDAQAYQDAVQEAWRQAQSFSVSARMRRFDGEWRWVETRGAARFRADGAYLGLSGSATDITEQYEFEARRDALLADERAARTTAETSARFKDEFLGTLSHELRTPLSVVLGWSKLLKSKSDPDNALLQRGLEAIIRSAEAQTALISDMLDASGLQLGEVELAVSTLEMSHIVQQAIDRIAALASARGVTFVWSPPDTPIWVRGDANRLRQIFANLLSNAVKFSPSGSDVHIRVDQSGEQVFSIAVEDDGEGIDPSFLPHIFDRFRQGDASQSRHNSGVGLGLAIVDRLVAMHDGAVVAHSDGKGRGATFIVTLPHYFPDPAEAADILAPHDASAIESHPDQALAGLRVLAVDDQEDILEHLRRILEDQGAQVHAVSSAAAALAALRSAEYRFDALVSDIGMPEMDGYQMMRTVRAELKLDPIALHSVAVTALAREQDRVAALAAGYQAHVTKPYEVSRLISALRTRATL